MHSGPSTSCTRTFSLLPPSATLPFRRSSLITPPLWRRSCSWSLWRRLTFSLRCPLPRLGWQMRYATAIPMQCRVFLKQTVCFPFLGSQQLWSSNSSHLWQVSGWTADSGVFLSSNILFNMHCFNIVMNCLFKLRMFIQRLSGPTIGFYCLDLFEITYPTYASVCFLMSFTFA